MATFNKVFNFTDMFLRKKPEKDDLFEANISKKKKKNLTLVRKHTKHTIRVVNFVKDDATKTKNMCEP